VTSRHSPPVSSRAKADGINSLPEGVRPLNAPPFSASRTPSGSRAVETVLIVRHTFCSFPGAVHAHLEFPRHFCGSLKHRVRLGPTAFRGSAFGPRAVVAQMVSRDEMKMTTPQKPEKRSQTPAALRAQLSQLRAPRLPRNLEWRTHHRSPRWCARMRCCAK